MTSYISVPTHGCCHRNRPLRTKRGACRRVRTDVSVRSEEPSRAVSKSSVAPAPPLCYWDAGNNCGQMVLGAGQVRATTPLSAGASDFIKCHWGVDGPEHEWLSETPVLDLPHVSQALLEWLADVVLRNTHTSMIDVADLSMFPLLQTPSQAAEPVAAMAVESAAEAKAFVLKRPFAQPKDTELLKPSERNLVYTSA